MFKSYEEKEILDRILDLAIALEVLFSASARLDLPHFIGSTENERLMFNDKIRKLREIRDKIVHSGYCEVSYDFVNQIENIFRLSIQKF